jgi:hypothetical protein
MKHSHSFIHSLCFSLILFVFLSLSLSLSLAEMHKKPILPKHFDKEKPAYFTFMDLSSEEMARQLTLLGRSDGCYHCFQSQTRSLILPGTLLSCSLVEQFLTTHILFQTHTLSLLNS